MHFQVFSSNKKSFNKKKIPRKIPLFFLFLLGPSLNTVCLRTIESNVFTDQLRGVTETQEMINKDICYSRVLSISRIKRSLSCCQLVHPPPGVHGVHLVVLHLLGREHGRLVVHDATESNNFTPQLSTNDIIQDHNHRFTQSWFNSRILFIVSAATSFVCCVGILP